MAMGIFPGAGGVKEAKEIYIGAGGVKTVKEVYIGQGGSVRKVWPAYTDYGGDAIELVGSSLSIVTSNPYSYMITNGTNSGYTYRRSGSFDYTNNSNHASGSARAYTTGMTFNGGYNIHWYSIGPIDTRGYHYMVASFQCCQYANNSIEYYLAPIIGYNSNPDNNPYYGGHYSAAGSFTNMGNIRISTAWTTSYYNFLFDFSSISLESTYIQIGGQISYADSDGACAALNCNSCILYQEKPSTSVSATITL